MLASLHAYAHVLSAGTSDMYRGRRAQARGPYGSRAPGQARKRAKMAVTLDDLRVALPGHRRCTAAALRAWLMAAPLGATLPDLADARPCGPGVVQRCDVLH